MEPHQWQVPSALQVPSTIFFLFFFILILSKLLLSKKIPYTNNINLPPGPRKLPVIGNMHQMAGATLPHRKLRDLARKYGPVMHLRLGEIETVVVSTPDTAKEVMKTHDLHFASRPNILASEVIGYGSQDIVFAPYGEYWRQLRKICVLELLSSRRVQSFQKLRAEEAKNLVKSINIIASSNNERKEYSSGGFNLSGSLLSFSYSLTAKATFGMKCKDQEVFIECLKETIRFAGGFNVADVFPSNKLLCLLSGARAKMEKLHKQVDDVLADIIKEHRAARPSSKSKKLGLSAEISNSNNVGEAAADHHDLVDVLLRLQDDGDLEIPLTITNIKAVILDMFAAGSDTSSTTLVWAMSELLRSPKAMGKAQAEVRGVVNRRGYVDEADVEEMKYLKAVIKETLRLRPPLPLLLPRECREQCQVNGFDVPVKTKVIVNIWALGRDPDYWVEPEKFYPERFLDNSMDYKGTNFEFLPFGAGRRMCPGMLFGTTNVQVTLAHLLYHFDWELPSGTDCDSLDMTEDFGATVARKNDLYVIPTPYVPSL